MFFNLLHSIAYTCGKNICNRHCACALELCVLFVEYVWWVRTAVRVIFFVNAQQCKKKNRNRDIMFYPAMKNNELFWNCFVERPMSETEVSRWIPLCTEDENCNEFCLFLMNRNVLWNCHELFWVNSF